MIPRVESEPLRALKRHSHSLDTFLLLLPDKSIVLYIGRKIILAMHGAYALMLLKGIDPFRALAYLTSVFVPIATYLGFVRDTREKMEVTNVAAWWGWIVSSLVVAVGILLDGNVGSPKISTKP